MPIERLPADAQLDAQRADLGAVLAHRRLRQAQPGAGAGASPPSPRTSFEEHASTSP